jgi:zinc/manganese transport system substrate-binding protein
MASGEAHSPRKRRRIVAVVLATAAACALAADFALTSGRAAPSTTRLHVVAAESSWGSIAAEIGGSRVDVTSVVDNPAADPHDYEPTAADARAVATARLVIANGAGYDPWLPRLAAASPNGARIALTVGDLVGVKAGSNPHLWYSPADVHVVVGRIVADYVRLDPAGVDYFRSRAALFERGRLAAYKRLIASIRTSYRDTRVGASESVFAPLAASLGLKLVTPASLLAAVSEGAEPTAGDLATAERQIDRSEIAIWIVNRQNSTPDVARLTAAARARGIPVVTITETPSPAGVAFEAWQTRQLEALAAALKRAVR